MDSISSTSFRTTYAKLTEPTMVTVNGHPIGVWLPGTNAPRNFEEGAGTASRTYVTPESPRVETPQQKRDAILRRISKG